MGGPYRKPFAMSLMPLHSQALSRVQKFFHIRPLERWQAALLLCGGGGSGGNTFLAGSLFVWEREHHVLPAPSSIRFIRSCSSATASIESLHVEGFSKIIDLI